MLKDGGVLDGEQVVPAEWIEQMIRPSERDRSYGLFTWLGAGLTETVPDPTKIETQQTEPFLAADAFMLLGLGGQRVYISRALDLVVVRLGPFSGYAPLKAGWDNSRLFNIVARGIKGAGDSVIR
jgi:CubicO group peptidase (beta-lactamase class C family)